MPMPSTSVSAARCATPLRAHVDVRAAQCERRDFLAGHRLDHVGTGEEHEARAGHDHEVGERGRVDGAAGARPHDQRDLRDHARRHHVAHEHLAVRGEAAHAFLDARAAGVVEPDQRDPALERQVLDPADLLRLHLGERAAQHGEVLREHRDAPAVDLAEAGDDAVAREALLVEAELAHVVRRERAELLERAFVEQQREPLARRQLAPRVLLLDALLAAAENRAAAHLAQRRQVFAPLAVHAVPPAAPQHDTVLRMRAAGDDLNQTGGELGPMRPPPGPVTLRSRHAAHLEFASERFGRRPRARRATIRPAPPKGPRMDTRAAPLLARFGLADRNPGACTGPGQWRGGGERIASVNPANGKRLARRGARGRGRRRRGARRRRGRGPPVARRPGARPRPCRPAPRRNSCASTRTRSARSSRSRTARSRPRATAKCRR